MSTSWHYFAPTKDHYLNSFHCCRIYALLQCTYYSNRIKLILTTKCTVYHATVIFLYHQSMTAEAEPCLM